MLVAFGFEFVFSIQGSCPMTFTRSHTSLAKLNGELYVFGGSHDGVWYDTVESYDPFNNRWIQRPCLNRKKGSMAGASMYDTIFTLGGGNGVEFFSEVELFDLHIGSWLSTEPMLEKRSAAADLNGALYVGGGYDGRDYLRYALGGYDGDTMVSSVEVFDPRIDSWMMVEPMKASRGCFGSFVLGGRIYVTGGLQDTQVLDQARETNEGH
ncbi:kelch-like protein 8 isoform X2 [Salvia splendens]|uniref:kelch-like protein 8 isoform X2 n=1 Tax=Salvia splendens TaxID=180675 RepID=UPI001C252FDC|nr:kelch-like protein 8 isoform X2 [Salvia splendens]